MAELTVNDYIYVKLNDLYEYLTSYNYPSIIDDMYTWFPEDIAYEISKDLGYVGSDHDLHDDLDGINDKLDQLITLLTPEEKEPVIGEDGKPIETDPYIIKLNQLHQDNIELNTMIGDENVVVNDFLADSGRYIIFIFFVLAASFICTRISNAAKYLRRV